VLSQLERGVLLCLCCICLREECGVVVGLYDNSLREEWLYDNSLREEWLYDNSLREEWLYDKRV